MESSRHMFPTGNLKCTHEFIQYQGTTTMHGHVMSSHSNETSQIQKQQNHFFCIQNTQNNKKCQESVTIFSPPLLRLRSLVLGLSYQALVMGPPSILITTWVQGFDLDRTSSVSFLLTLRCVCLPPCHLLNHPRPIQHNPAFFQDPFFEAREPIHVLGLNLLYLHRLLCFFVLFFLTGPPWAFKSPFPSYWAEFPFLLRPLTFRPSTPYLSLNYDSLFKRKKKKKKMA